jgi:hypothetical protein
MAMPVFFSAVFSDFFSKKVQNISGGKTGFKNFGSD